MPGDFSLHVVHASVTEFDGVSIANFVKRMGLWEGLLNNSQELFTNVSFHIFTEGWVEPCYFPIPIFCSWGFVSGIGVKFKFVAVTIHTSSYFFILYEKTFKLSLKTLMMEKEKDE